MRTRDARFRAVSSIPITLLYATAHDKVSTSDTDVRNVKVAVDLHIAKGRWYSVWAY